MRIGRVPFRLTTVDHLLAETTDRGEREDLLWERRLRLAYDALPLLTRMRVRVVAFLLGWADWEAPDALLEDRVLLRRAVESGENSSGRSDFCDDD